MEGKEYRFKVKSDTYGRMSIPYHKAFYERLKYIASTETGKGRAYQQAVMLPRHMKDVKNIIRDISNDVMVANIDYYRKGDARVAGYTLQETRDEMKESRTTMESAVTESPRHQGGRAHPSKKGKLAYVCIAEVDRDRGKRSTAGKTMPLWICW